MTVKASYFCPSCGFPLEPVVKSDTYACRCCGMVWDASYLEELEAKRANQQRKKKRFVFR